MGSEDKTIPVLKNNLEKRPTLSDNLSNYLDKQVGSESVEKENIKFSAPQKNTDSRPFMDELFVDNFNIKGFKTDITGG